MRSALPPLYARWIQELMGREFAGEPRATCSNCKMCEAHTPPTPSDFAFHPNAKCCTFTPALPNYLVGAILRDEDPACAEGRALFEREAPLQSVGPLGIGPTGLYRLYYTFKPFGRIEMLVCPYFIPRDGGLCGIWLHRNATCATWFCTFERGRTGFHFWDKLRVFLSEVENELALRCVRQLNLQIPEDTSDPAEAVWGNWFGKEREFYRECHRIVSGMSAAEIMEVAGHKAAGMLADLRNALRDVESDAIPEPLILADCRTCSLENGFTRIWAYSKYDPLDLSDVVLGVLPAFDGRPTEAVVREIEQERGVRLSRFLLRKLVDTRILKAPLSSSDS